MSVITWDTAAVATSRTVSERARTVRRPARVDSAGLRLTRRGRLVVTAMAVVLAGLVTLTAQNATAGSAREPLEVDAYTVMVGDTLWSIAGSVAAPGQDRRAVVDQIISINGLDGASLAVGQLLVVPAG